MEVLATEYFECLKFTIVPKAIGRAADTFSLPLVQLAMLLMCSYIVHMFLSFPVVFVFQRPLCRQTVARERPF